MKICNFCKLEKPLDEFYTNKSVKSGKTTFCKICGKTRRDAYYITNREKVLKKQKEHNARYHTKVTATSKQLRKQYARKYVADRLKRDIVFKLRHYMRNSINRALRSILQEKDTSSLEVIGCIDWTTFKEHLEKQFTGNMIWDNYGPKGWHIDHIIPISSAKTVEDVLRLSHYTNLQPLWARDNYLKSNKLI
jgi:hypothetical protein